jgi:hypothetical protein
LVVAAKISAEGSTVMSWIEPEYGPLSLDQEIVCPFAGKEKKREITMNAFVKVPILLNVEACRTTFLCYPLLNASSILQNRDRLARKFDLREELICFPKA